MQKSRISIPVIQNVIELFTVQDNLFKDAMEYAAESKNAEVAEDLLAYFLEHKAYDCFAACLFQVFDNSFKLANWLADQLLIREISEKVKKFALLLPYYCLIVALFKKADF